VRESGSKFSARDRYGLKKVKETSEFGVQQYEQNGLWLSADLGPLDRLADPATSVG
jgi:hypothetical protein